MVDTTIMLLNHLGTGKKNAKTEQELATSMGMTPLETRRAIHAARTKDRVVICNLLDGTGYFIPETDEERLAQYRLTVHRGKAVFNQVNALLADMGKSGQMRLEDIIAETEAI